MDERGQLQNPLNPIPQPLRNLAIIRPIPNADNILRVPNRDDSPTNLIRGDTRKLTPDQCENDFFPVPRGQTLFKPYDPFATPGIGRILPGGLDPLAEEVVVGGSWQIVGADEEIVDGPEFLDGVDGSYLPDGGFVGVGWVLFVEGVFSGGGVGVGFFFFFCLFDDTFATAHVPEGEWFLEFCFLVCLEMKVGRQEDGSEWRMMDERMNTCISESMM